MAPSVTLGAHPCVRGASLAAPWTRYQSSGSSLRARGFLLRGPRQGGARGLIPACAGLPRGRPARTRGRRAHPCVRGASFASTSPTPLVVGSSLRARGFPSVVGVDDSDTGLIPACAGLPASVCGGDGHLEAHPCVRGASPPRRPPCQTGSGSSLRARGFPVDAAPVVAVDGLIPACAGLPGVRWSGTADGRAHPCVRGASGLGGVAHWGAPGSSLRARGFHYLARADAPRSALSPSVEGGWDDQPVARLDMPTPWGAGLTLPRPCPAAPPDGGPETAAPRPFRLSRRPRASSTPAPRSSCTAHARMLIAAFTSRSITRWQASHSKVRSARDSVDLTVPQREHAFEEGANRSIIFTWDPAQEVL